MQRLHPATDPSVPATSSVDTAIFDKKPRFLGVFLVTSLIGVLLISIAVYRASRELEVIHEVDNMSRVIRSLLGEEAIERLIRGERAFAQGAGNALRDADYRFFVVADNGIRAVQKAPGDDVRRLQSLDLESTRINERGGYFEADGAIRTWVTFPNKAGTKALLVVHRFSSGGTGALVHAYRQRMIIPVFFYLWLMVWVSLILNHLLRELSSQKNRMRQMALHDALTGLPNRTLMHDRLAKLIQSSRRDRKQFAFSLIDLNGFKGINDRYGHLYGDELLRQAAKRIEGALRGSDTAARLGGDEFVVLLASADEAGWQAVFERILHSLNAPYTLSDTEARLGASIGVAIFPVHGEDADALLLRADWAMYAAKAKGGGIHVFEPEPIGSAKNATA